MDVNYLSSYNCPRWSELPSLDLYLDQVLIVINKATQIFPGNITNTVTSTMINNYVKQKVIAPTIKKKYNREHLADLIMITLLKQVLSITEISVVLDQLKKNVSPEDAYNLFCQLFEASLKEAAGSGETTNIPANMEIPYAAVKALAGKIVFKTLSSDLMVK